MKTKSGFEIEICKDALDDWELLEDLADLENGNSGKIISVARRFLGADGLTKLTEHCRTPEGRVPASAVEEELGELFKLAREDLGKEKNS